MLVEKLAPKADGKVFDIYPFITFCALDIICGKYIPWMQTCSCWLQFITSETAMGVQINALENAQSKYIESVYE